MNRTKILAMIMAFAIVMVVVFAIGIVAVASENLASYEGLGPENSWFATANQNNNNKNTNLGQNFSGHLKIEFDLMYPETPDSSTLIAFSKDNGTFGNAEISIQG